MTLTAHVPATAGAQTFELISSNPFAVLGDRLVQLGLALQRGESTVEQLVPLAKACGLELRIKVVEGELC
ncbi:hypothetical protein N7414_20060 [Pseudomonas sp. GD04087]|uniref:hypothetical protein n=1 Tax=unclassified Pseudomonas TaxID=196821 RepID=UPI0024478EF5|nr:MULTISPECIES: hypothetical protein [unclassified Pseudomonas]MDH0291426.1 hypothetical protein [Pseudomonas sp. GD04087]MDH1051738.1 hypothetical protein [Pseudomonas sp. GD03903]MDH2001728.1 hypothetical protein [Pseudomonas sp. GD03691]